MRKKTRVEKPEPRFVGNVFAANCYVDRGVAGKKNYAHLVPIDALAGKALLDVRDAKRLIAWLKQYIAWVGPT